MNSPFRNDRNSSESVFHGRSYRLNGGRNTSSRSSTTTTTTTTSDSPERNPDTSEPTNSAGGVSFRGRSYRLGNQQIYIYLEHMHTTIYQNNVYRIFIKCLGEACHNFNDFLLCYMNDIVSMPINLEGVLIQVLCNCYLMISHEAMSWQSNISFSFARSHQINEV